LDVGIAEKQVSGRKMYILSCFSGYLTAADTMKYILLLLRLIAVIIVVPSYAGVQEITLDSGLPNKCINSICKDNRGLMWVGTPAGLFVYDGYQFMPLHFNNALGQVSITKLLYVPQDDLLWAATENGLYKIHCRNFKAEYIRSAQRWSESSVTDMVMNKEGRIFASYKTGEIIQVERGNAIAFLTKIPSANPQYIYPVSLKYRDSALRIGSYQSPLAYSYSFITKKIIETSPDPLPVPGIEVKGNKVSVCLEGSRKVWDMATDSKLPAFLNSLKGLDNISTIDFISGDEAWIICRPCKVYRVNFKLMTFDTASSAAFSGRLAKSTFTDANGIAWIGTNKGLLKITPDRGYFERQLFTTPEISVRSFAFDESGNKYAGTYAGLFKWSYGEHSWVKKADFIPFSMISVPGKYVYFLEDRFRLWRMDKASGKIETDFYTTSAQVQAKVFRGAYLAAGNIGKLLIGTNSGLAMYDPVSNSLSELNFKNFNDRNIEVRFIKVVSNRILLGTNSGFYEINTTNGHVFHSGTAGLKLSSEMINGLDIDEKGNVWLCSENGGVNIINNERSAVTVINAQSGLCNNTVYNLVFNHGYAWISTFNGLSSYNLKTGKFYNFYSNTDGLTDNEFNRNAFAKDSLTGEIYFGTINGINVFNPEQLKQKSEQSLLFAATISKWDNGLKSYTNLDPSDSTIPLVMGATDHSLMISLALSDYTNREKAVFSYRIKGFLDNWINLNNQNIIQLNGLPPGEYTVEVRALDGHGMIAANELNYKIKVLQHFYKSVWFYLLILLAVCLILYFLFLQKLRNMEEINNIKQQIASDLHDEVGSFLTRITMSSDNLIYTDNTEQEKSVKLSKISALGRSAASSMNDILWAIDTRNNFSGNLSDRMREHAEEMLLPLSIDLAFDFQLAQKRNISASTKQELYLIFKEAINNIAKHSKATKVLIRFQHNRSRLLLHISNNGYRTDAKGGHSGYGLKNIKMRAERIGAAATVSNEDEWFHVTIVGRS
jgi:signal transduction histidine kinase/ligand-binding sensor domain-containing protein